MSTDLPIILRIVRKRSTEEWVVRVTRGGIPLRAADYYTNDRDDAELTAESMRETLAGYGDKVTIVGSRRRPPA